MSRARVSGCVRYSIPGYGETVRLTEFHDLVAEQFTGVPVRGDIAGNGTLLSIDKARRVLGYAPEHSWR